MEKSLSSEAEKCADVAERSEYKGKLFSVLGDSISTLGGYSEPYGAAYYAGAMKFETGVCLPEDTWWGKVIGRLGGELLANDSFAGSTVCKPRGCAFPSYAASDERTSGLGRSGASPDVIMIFMGINDWGCGFPPFAKDGEKAEGSLSVFSSAYALMLEKLRKNYPMAELWCFTLPLNPEKREEAELLHRRNIEEYCRAIRECAKKIGARAVDLSARVCRYGSEDGFHPNKEGMETLAKAALESLSL